MKSYFVITILACLYVGTNSFPCPFAMGMKEQCNCTFDVAYLKGECENVEKIPMFSDSQITISSLSIAGNFSTIPNNSFYGLGHSVLRLRLESKIEGGKKKTLNIESMAFNTNKDHSVISSIEFVGYKTDMEEFRPALANAYDLTELKFNKCFMDTLKNDTFQGMKTLTKLEINDCHLVLVEDEAFSGALNGTLNQLSLARNDLIEMPRAIEMLDALVMLDVSDNKIEKMHEEFRFPPAVVVIDISDNPLGNISSGAFDDATNVRQLTLDRCDFTEIPSVLKTSQIYKTLENVQLNGNKIHVIDDTFGANKFLNLAMMPGLDDNPVDYINETAFEGLVNVDDVSLTNFYQLETFNFVAFAEMVDLRSVRVENFHLLQSALLSDAERLGKKLKLIAFSYCDRLDHLNENFADWLDKDKDNVLDLSNNMNFGCSKDIKWLAKYAFCSFHPQVIAKNSFCADTRVPLEAYLSTLNGVCDE